MFKLGHTVFFTVAYDGACSCNVSFRMVLISFNTLPCKKKTWQLASRCCWNRARRLTCFLSASVTRKGLQFGREQTPLSNVTIDSVLRHREVGRAKDLSASPRTEYIALLLWIIACFGSKRWPPSGHSRIKHVEECKIFIKLFHRFNSVIARNRNVLFSFLKDLKTYRRCIFGIKHGPAFYCCL